MYCRATQSVVSGSISITWGHSPPQTSSIRISGMEEVRRGANISVIRSLPDDCIRAKAVEALVERMSQNP